MEILNGFKKRNLQKLKSFIIFHLIIWDQTYMKLLMSKTILTQSTI